MWSHNLEAVLCFWRTLHQIQVGFVERRGGFLPSQACMTPDKKGKRQGMRFFFKGHPDTAWTHTCSNIHCRESRESSAYLLENVWKPEMWRCDPGSSPYPFCLVMEMWHGGWMRTNLLTVPVCVWTRRPWKWKEKHKKDGKKKKLEYKTETL